MSEPVTMSADTRERWTALLRRAAGLGDSEPLEARVLRPLRKALGVAVAASGGADLREVTLEATRLRVADPQVPVEMLEATGGLQHLACTAGVVDAAELREIQGELSAEVRVAPGGPYLVTNAEDLDDHLGVPVPAHPQMALCRCGRSEDKPFCDGSHATGFDDAKDPKRVPDRRDTYVGQQVTVFDNRGICQHSGYCTDRLATVFHTGGDPFVTPSGGRMDEIIRAVRDCPSGALSYAIDGREAREQVDRPRPPRIEVSHDGPYRVTGGIPLVSGSGSDVPRAEGSSREHYALCRCGQSQNKPFCSGMHYYVGFRDPAPTAEPTVFEWAGGLPGLTRMTRIFYEKYVPEDSLLAPLFATMSADHPQRVAKWLAEVFGGPSCYSNEYGGYPRMLSQHIGRCLTEEQRSRWVELLMRSARDAGLPNDAEFQAGFHSYIEWGSRLAVENSQPGSQPPEHMPMPHWGWTTGAGAPGGRISATAHEPEPDHPVVLPAPDEEVEFAAHIKPLFRESDRRSMRFVFDLWSHDDVSTHAEAILARLRDGSMPCDKPWPAEHVDVFARWADTGMAP